MRRLGVYVRLGDRIDLAVNELIQRLGRRLLDDLPRGRDRRAARRTRRSTWSTTRAAPSAPAIDAWLAGHLAAARAGGGDVGGNFVRVPVRYDGEDFAAVCEATGLARHELIDLHSGRDYKRLLGRRLARLPVPRRARRAPAHAAAPDAARASCRPTRSR